MEKTINYLIALAVLEGSVLDRQKINLTRAPHYFLSKFQNNLLSKLAIRIFSEEISKNFNSKYYYNLTRPYISEYISY